MTTSIKFIIAIALAISGFIAGAKYMGYKCKAEKLDAVSKMQKDAHAQGVEDMQLEQDAQNQRTITKIEYRDREVKIHDAINQNPSACVIAHVVRLQLDDAIRAANSKISADTGKLPATKQPSK